jgi:uncharacterized protein (TIGR02217 family)
VSTDFEEVRLEGSLIIEGTIGGPTYSTDVIVVKSGREKRNTNWNTSRGRWEIGERQLDIRELHSLIGFFRARQGKSQGFRFKDWGDYKATHAALTVNGVTTQGLLGTGVGDGTTTYKFNKIYTSGGTSTLRRIQKPVASPAAAIHVDGVLQTSGYTISTSAGTVVFSSTKTGAQTLTWEGTFDVPVRFDTDEFRSRFDVIRVSDGEALHWLMSLPVVELRVAE